ncbi:MAG: YceI family protein [Bacteroidetes bacterium]|nr:YceI family protein [Bacteroidota bacterium]
MTFYSHAPIEDITAENKQPGSMINMTTRDIAVIIPIRNFKFAKELMQEHFNEKYMESEKYPMASFKGIITDDVDISKDGEVQATAKGIISIHGVEKEMTLTGTMKRTGNSISLISDFKIAIKDFNITVPKLLFENIAEVIDVHVALDYKPFQKSNSTK